ncbi:MBL fold metallo-hydrolase [Singulisphaera rosea]
MSVQFAVLASGSQGNSTLVQSGGVGTLIDFGIGPRALGRRLESVGSSWSRVSAAFLTHTHGDHVNNATLHMMARHRIALYCHETHRPALRRHSGFLELDEMGLVRHYDDEPFLTPTGLRVEALELRHDGPTFGFRFELKPARSRRSVSLGYLADTGSWSMRVVEALVEVDLLGIEFNHDVEMQLRAPRHVSLIARNLSDHGHLSNAQGAALVSEVLGRSGVGSIRHLVLLHLSQQCNHPKLALGTAREAVRAQGHKTKIHAASQSVAHPNLRIDPKGRRTSARRLEIDTLPF